ncbi:DUF459 domain-containing protein [Allomesorhizobium alhagi]|jgi:hypothetical protein|uniref:SGNH hydrolase-type esterase domain-containing protein n=1 Tax=Mesorhizobium alhagi CCNWXJ12-2 TaxID=1107882 RepID=H0HNN4_9HYPH|nr:DUF459 domain-containing protein [Mesorhizobium alhagi]EHK57687.1 hypothetical protein MAXJ12_08784 [Mesorhizobium alhagi CCNWXJ12-2]
MPSHQRIWFAARRLFALVLALAVLVTGISIAAPIQVAAQEYRPWLRNLWVFPRRERERRVIRRTVPRREVRRKAVRRSTGQARKSVPRRNVERAERAEAVEPEVQAVEKIDDAKIVLVVGDFLASGLAEGLTEAYAENPRVKVVDRSNGSSGLVRDDFFDWPGEIAGIVEEEKPSAIVVMLGSNDRQQMKAAGEREPVRSEGWTKEYTLRADKFGKTIADGKVPFIWVGMPAFKSSKMTSDMLAFNDIYRTSAKGAGAEFIDIWDGFVDENGAFVTTGPDVNGQPARLRSGDGINMTAAGKRKLAFYAEKPLNKILGETTGPEPVAMAPATLPAVAPGAPNAAPVDRTAPISLADPQLDGATELLGAQAPKKQEARTPGERLAIEGVAPEAAPGRADDFSRPRKPPAPAATPEDAETTTAIGR